MKKTFKSFACIICIAAILFLSSISVYAAIDRVHYSTYSVTGGVRTKQFNTSGEGGKKSYVSAKLNPTRSIENANITMFLEKLNGNVYGSKAVNSSANSVSIWTGLPKGGYKVYLRNYSGLLMEGKCTFRWS